MKKFKKVILKYNKINSFTSNIFKTQFLCFVLFMNVPTFAQITEVNYKIYSTRLNKEVNVNDIVEDMKNYNVLFFGEEHNDSVAHFLEHKIFETLHQSFSNNTTLSMEMFDRDVQTVMNEYLQGSIREKNFTKDARSWSNYRDYKPMVEYAKSNKLDVICANSPTRYTNLAGRKGQQALVTLSKEAKKYFAPLPYDTASGKYYEKLIALTKHDVPTSTDTTKAKLPPIMPSGFNLIMGQSLWDATMAYSISKYLKQHKDKKVLHINGRFHSDEGFAIVTQLKKYSPKIKSLIISSGTDDSFPNIDWNMHKHLGDYIIITDPNIPRTYKE